MILYQGPSEFDGAPIVVLVTFDSTNRKTGNMPQFWILAEAEKPSEAVRSGADAAVCGSCPQRFGTGGACYVLAWEGPTSTWKAYQAGDHAAEPSRREALELERLPLRLGAYGDPAAVPYGVWEALLGAGSGRWAGYTHAWRDCDPRFREILMASCDTIEEAKEAQAAGWRTFTVVPEGYRPDEETARILGIECPYQVDGTQCRFCTACDGRRGAEHAKASVWVHAHGMRRRRYSLPVVR